MAEPVDPESAVRRYLAWLEDPASVIDQGALHRAEEAFASATDPIDRLHAAAARERARAADVAAITRNFVAHARVYGEAESIPVEAFRALGVPDDVLSEAGFAMASLRRRRGPAVIGDRRSGLRSGERAPQVGVVQIKEALGSVAVTFTLAQLAEQAGGGSPATVRKAVDGLIAEGRVEKLGPDPDHTGPGRAPTRYRRH